MEKIIDGSKFSKLSFGVRTWVILAFSLPLALIILSLYCFNLYFEAKNAVDKNMLTGLITPGMDYSTDFFMIAGVLLILGTISGFLYFDRVRKKKWGYIIFWMT
jgi:hypothetical protein